MDCDSDCGICARLRGAALDLAGSHGARSVTVEQLAARAGIAPEDVTDHYPDAAACVYAAYDEVSAEMRAQAQHAFAEKTDGRSGYERARHRLLERLAENPAEARLCFVETVRGDRELQRRLAAHRRWAVQFLAAEYRRDQTGAELSDTQFELLVGAEFQAISQLVADGGAADLIQLEPTLTDVTGAFIPASA